MPVAFCANPLHCDQLNLDSAVGSAVECVAGAHCLATCVAIAAFLSPYAHL